MTRAPAARIVVTGIGAVSAWGWGIDPFWSGVRCARTAIRPLDRFDPSDYYTHIAGQAPDPPAEVRARFPRWRRWSVCDRFSVASAAEAIEQAKLPADLSTLDLSVFFGSSTGGMFESEMFYRTLRNEPRERMSLALLASQEVSAPGDAVARHWRVSGPVQTLSSACSSATLAIGLALEALRDGSSRIAIAGGADSLCRVTYGGFNSLRSVDERPCAPFRTDRRGLSLGEGGAVLVLERLDSARERGVTPLAELLGAGSSADAHHMTAPHPDGDGAALAVDRALRDAGCSAERIDFVNAHGTGTELNDLAEYGALRSVLGQRAEHVPVCATKASVGHLLGSAGAIEAVATVLGLLHGQVHPTPGDGQIDPRTPLKLLSNTSEATDPPRVGLSLNLAFGGCNAALLFGRWSAS